MSKTANRQYLQKRYDKVQSSLCEDMTTEEYHKCQGRLEEIDNFAANFGVKLKRVTDSIISSEDVKG